MKNYYKILGVLDDAEDIVIRAAYKALAQRYHPDKWKGDSEIANQKMRDINEAHAILSDELKRKSYDQEYFKFNSRDDAENTANSESDDFPNDEIEGWDLAVEFFPSIKYQYDELRKISNILANTFRASVLENKSFKESDLIKQRFENEYLTRFYGDIELVRIFAKRLLCRGHHKAAVKINKIVRVMGGSVDFTSIRNKIYSDFPSANPMNDAIIKNSVSAFLANKYSPIDLINIIEYEHSIKVESSDYSSNFTFVIDGKLYEKIGISSLHLVATEAVKSMTYGNYS
jgi:curved DNA-binding protein CbpA